VTAEPEAAKQCKRFHVESQTTFVYARASSKALLIINATIRPLCLGHCLFNGTCCTPIVFSAFTACLTLRLVIPTIGVLYYDNRNNKTAIKLGANGLPGF